MLSFLAYVLVPSFGTIVDVEISRGILATFFADFMDADSNQTYPAIGPTNMSGWCRFQWDYKSSRISLRRLVGLIR